MKTIFKIFKSDIYRIRHSVVAIIIIIGLCIIPSLYAWFNILSNWDPYGQDSTSQIRVAVTSEDSGVEFLGLDLNIGKMVLDGISSNKQMGWVMVESRDDALKKVESGDCYAALIVSDDFSKDFVSILSDEPKHPTIDYIENEKKNAIAPKITDKAKTAVQEQINSTVMEKTADVFTNISAIIDVMGITPKQFVENTAQSLEDDCDELEQLVEILNSVRDLGNKGSDLLDYIALTVDDTGKIVSDVSKVLDDAENSINTQSDSNNELNTALQTELNKTDESIQNIIDTIGHWGDTKGAQNEINDALNRIQSNLEQIQSKSSENPTQLSNAKTAFDNMNSLKSKLEDESNRTDFINYNDELKSALNDFKSLISDNDITALIENILEDSDAIDLRAKDWGDATLIKHNVKEQLTKLREQLANQKDRSKLIASYLEAAIKRVDNLIEKIDKLDDPNVREEFIEQLQKNRESLVLAVMSLSGNVSQHIQNGLDIAQNLVDKGQSFLNQNSTLISNTSESLKGFSSLVSNSRTSISDSIELIETVQMYMNQVATDLRDVADSDGFNTLVDVMANHSDNLSEYLTAPVNIKTVYAYKIDNYGSAMAPYYIMLALFVGSLLACTLIKVTIKNEKFEHASNLQSFFGRYFLFFCIAMIQALITSCGCIFYVGIQCQNIGLFILGCCAISLNFSLFNYSLVYALDKVGTALLVIIMVIQVAGSGGSYPIDVLPEIFQKLYPYMPFHYGMDLIRETIGGFYDDTYLKCTLILLGMSLLFIILGLLLYLPAKKLNKRVAESMKKTGVM